MTTIGMRIRALRQEAGWTQAELGTPEFSKAYISQIESGRITPSLATLSVIASKLGTSLEGLLPQGDQGHREQDLERLWRAAERLQEHGEHATAVDLVEQAARLSAASQDPKLRGEGHLRYAIALWESGHSPQALDECEEAIEAFGGAGDSQYLGRAYNLAGLIYRDLGEWAAARRYFLRALRLFPRRVVWHSRVLLNLSILLARAGSFKEAADYSRRAIELTHSYGDGEQEAKTRIALSYTLIETGDPTRALQELDTADRLLRAAGKESLVRLCRHNRVIAAHRLGLEGADEELRAWLMEVEVVGDRQVATALYEELCRQSLREGRFRAAADYAAQGVAHARALHARQYEGTLLALQAEALLRDGDTEAGTIAFVQARDLHILMRQGAALAPFIHTISALPAVEMGLLLTLLETPLPDDNGG
ncbi:MAG: helix-turn-helix domain-containing protein [Thermaerobacter sp.]|nr:helix-turn-helix domain-containing protein [Thermaerobacter sp.]